MALSLAAAGAARTGRCAEPEVPSWLEVRDLTVESGIRVSRVRVLVPRDVAKDARLPLLVLLHGLGETESEAIGIRAWTDRYGLVETEARLRSPPVLRTRPGPYLPDDRLARINAALAEHPFHGLVVACPYTPNVYKIAPTSAALDRYAAFVTEALLPAVRAAVPAAKDVASTAIDGCSLGGYIALETFLRKPAHFGAVGGVQAALGERFAPLYAERIRAAIARVGPRSIHIETSLWDPFRAANTALSEQLRARSVPNDFLLLPGGHDQIFLREVGTLEMLLWHDRRVPAPAR